MQCSNTKLGIFGNICCAFLRIIFFRFYEFFMQFLQFSSSFSQIVLNIFAFICSSRLLFVCVFFLLSCSRYLFARLSVCRSQNKTLAYTTIIQRLLMKLKCEAEFESSSSLPIRFPNSTFWALSRQFNEINTQANNSYSTLKLCVLFLLFASLVTTSTLFYSAVSMYLLSS